jgi:capsule polysaccharide export protein KpsE/RkpR
MSDPEKPAAGEEETERVRKWREERAAVAEKEKQERVRVAKETRARELAAQQDEDKAAAATLLPDRETLEATKNRIRQKYRRAKHWFTLQIIMFVIVPTGLVVGYLGWYAVPLYEAKSVISITKPANDNSGGLGGLLGAVGSGSGDMNETFMADAYIKSQALIDQLEEKTGLVTYFSSDALDPYMRLRQVPFLSITKEDGFAYFVFSSIDIQTGLLTLYVRAPEPDMAIEISNNVLDLTAKQINTLSESLFRFRTELARQSVSEARSVLTEAQTTLTRLQVESGEINPTVRIEGIYATITSLEAELADIEGQIQLSDDTGQTDRFVGQRLSALKENVLELIDTQRARLVSPPKDGGRSLNQLLLDYELASLQLRIAEETLSTAILALASSSDDAALDQSQFLIVVPPRTSDYATIPNIPKAGFVAFLLFLSALSLYRLMPSARKS